MIMEQRIVFGINDITRFRVKCDCGGEAVSELAENNLTPDSCSFCDKSWRDPQASTPTHRLMKAIRDYRDSRAAYLTLSFEIDAKD